MIRTNGLLFINSSMNDGKFDRPHFQIRKFWHYLFLKTPSGQYALACSPSSTCLIFPSNNIF